MLIGLIILDWAGVSVGFFVQRPSTFSALRRASAGSWQSPLGSV